MTDLRPPHARMTPRARESDDVLRRLGRRVAEPRPWSDAVKLINGRIIPALKGLRGFTAVSFLADRSAGRLVAVAFYADEAALERSVEASHARNEVADAMGGKVVGVESYELVAQSW